MALMPRGIRNNNPGNINFANQKGAVLEPKTDSVPSPRFACFKDPKDGLRCLRDQLIRYYDHYQLHTVKGMISRWAPTSENNTASYIAGVAHSVGVEEDDTIHEMTPTIMTGLMNAIIRYENGMNPYGETVSDIAREANYSTLKAQ